MSIKSNLASISVIGRSLNDHKLQIGTNVTIVIYGIKNDDSLLLIQNDIWHAIIVLHCTIKELSLLNQLIDETTMIDIK